MTTNTLIDALRLHRLLDLKQMNELNSLGFPDPKSLAKELIQRGWLTPYQANQLLNGKGQELVLGSYILLERLGEGGMGQVFKARHRNLNRVAAIKLIRKERLDNPGAIRRFQREVRSAAALSHPNIVLAYDADEIAGTHLMVMEYIEGAIDLAKLVKKNGPLPVLQACEYIRQAALGLQHAHERGMVHRDIKPANLLLSDGGKTVKILDMGLARLDHPAEDDEQSSTMTQEGSVMGTPDYIAPEQALDTHTVDIRADLYSLGCAFYYLLTGRVPFPGGTFIQKINKHQFEEPLPIEKLRPEVTADVARVVRKLMAKKPADRYQTPAEAASALAAVGQALTGFTATPQASEATIAWNPDGSPAGAGSGGSLSSALDYIKKRDDTVAYEPPQSVRQKPKSRRWLIVLLGTSVSALLGLTILVFLVPRGDSQPKKDDEPIAGLKKPVGPIDSKVDDRKEFAKEKTSVVKKETPIAVAGATIDLLPLIDPAKDAVNGDWKVNEKGDLVSDAAEFARIRIPYRPPAEYDLLVSFTKLSGSEGPAQILVGGGRQFRLKFGGHANSWSYFDMVDGKGGKESRTAKFKNAWVTTGLRHESRVEVRKDSVKAYLDRVLATELLQTDFKNVNTHGVWSVNEPDVLGLVSSCPISFHKVQVVEISGPGTFTRPDAPAAKRAAEQRKSPKEPGPWQPLLDADLTKWGKHEEGEPDAIKVIDSGKELVLRLKRESKTVYLWPKELFQDHHWRLEFQFPSKEADKYFGVHWATGRFGFNLHSDGKVVAFRGKEVAANRAILQAGALVAKESLKEGNSPFADADLGPAGAWNRLDVVRVGSSFALFVNGRSMGALTDLRWPVGGKQTAYTGKDVTGTLQVGRGEVRMRNIEIRDIYAFRPELIEPGPWQSMMDGKLSQFVRAKTNKPEAVLVTNHDGEPNVRIAGEGRPHIYSKTQVQNVHLRLQFQTPSKGVMWFGTGQTWPGATSGIGFNIDQSGKSSVYLWGMKANHAALERGAIVSTGKAIPLSLTTSLADATLEPPGEWNRLDLVRVDDRFAFFVNGRFLGAVVDGNDVELGKATINISGAGDKGESSIRRIEVRDITAFRPELIEPGPWQAMLDPKLTKWGIDGKASISDIVKKAEPETVIRPSGVLVWPKFAPADHHLRLEFQFYDKQKAQLVSTISTSNGSSVLQVIVHNNGQVVRNMGATRGSDAVLQGGAIVAGNPAKDGHVTIGKADLLPTGSWNRLDVVREGDRIAYFVNGRFISAIANVRWLDKVKEIEMYKKITFNWGGGGEVLIRRIKVRDISVFRPELIEPGPWRPLFNGKDLTGWVYPKDDAKPEEYGKVNADGEPAIAISDPKGRRMRLAADYDNYHLRVQFRKEGPADLDVYLNLIDNLSSKGVLGLSINQGGIYLRRAETDRYHVATLEDGKFKAGPLADERWFFKKASMRPGGQWNDLEIVRLGDSGVIRLNGQLAGAFTGFRIVDGGSEIAPEKSVIAFAAHSGKLLLRHIEIRDITALPPELLAPPFPFDARKAQEYQQLWANHLGRKVEETNSIGMKLRLIPPGEFIMGDKGHGDSPPRTVRITRPFFMGTLEVTRKQYVDLFKDPTKVPKWVLTTDLDLPMGGIDWDEAARFCALLSAQPEERRVGRRYRLPTEAEWEYACRAGTNTRFHFGNEATAKDGNFKIGDKPAPLMKGGAFPANAWGLFDMHGNVREWCADWWDKDYPHSSPLNDPTGPLAGTQRECRGGGSGDPPISAGFRFSQKPDAKWGDLGFRVVCEIVPPALTGAFPPLDPAWLKAVAAMPPHKQVGEVSDKLKERNPGFDGMLKERIEGGVVTELTFLTDNVTDISPVRALTGLRSLTVTGSGWPKITGKLADLPR